MAESIIVKPIINPSVERLNMLHPAIRQSALDAYKEACSVTPANVHPVINETYRSYERSNQLYQQGRTKPGPIVTNAPGGSSWHNFSLAIDFFLLIDGKETWKVDANWMAVVNCFKKQGFTWGGEFKGTFKDYPHLEKTMGLSLVVCRKMYNEKKVDRDGYLLINK